MPRRDLSALADEPAFRDARSGLVALDPDLVIRAVNHTLLQATFKAVDEVLGRGVFDAYPGNPDDPNGNPERVFARSFERVLSTARTSHLVVRRYDVLDAREPGGYAERHWVPVHEPIHGDRGLAGILCRVDEVPPPGGRALAVVVRCRAALDGAPDHVALVGLAAAVVDALRSLGDLEREAEQLREALTSRATIDQAKGILMSRESIDADEAFARLVQLSNESNVRLADIALALVYQVQRGA